MTQAADLRRWLVAGDTVTMPGVWDPWSALLARQAGFRAVFLSGFALAGTHLGEPDIGILGRDDVADAARRVCAAVPDTVVVVDADTGYGDAAAAAETARLWEESGAAGLFLEDQVWPKRCGHMDGKQVVDTGEWLGKLRTVLDVRTDLFVTARTDAAAVRGLDDAIERAKMARDLGVDAVFVEAPSSVTDLETIGAALPDVTLVANMVENGRTPLLTPGELADMGFRLVLSPLSGLLAATRALGDAFAALQAHGTLRDSLHSLATFDEFTDLVGLPQHLANDGITG